MIFECNGHTILDGDADAGDYGDYGIDYRTPAYIIYKKGFFGNMSGNPEIIGGLYT
jgi:hypothetical protein